MVPTRRSPSDVTDKTCRVCGRRFTWRRSWARNWESVSVCSDACRARRRTLRGQGRALEEAILGLLADRAAGATICPSEAARAVDAEGWRDILEATREAGRRLVASGEVVFVQGGRIVDPSRAKGPVRIRKAGNGGVP